MILLGREKCHFSLVTPLAPSIHYYHFWRQYWAQQISALPCCNSDVPYIKTIQFVPDESELSHNNTLANH